MDERLRNIQRKFLQEPTEEIAIQFMQLQCRLDPPSYSGKSLKDLEPIMGKGYFSRFTYCYDEFHLDKDDPIEVLASLDAVELFNIYGMGSGTRIKLLDALVKTGFVTPQSWIRYFKRYSPILSDTIFYSQKEMKDKV